MADPMRVRAAENGGTVDVKILMKHDMESGQRKHVSSKFLHLQYRHFQQLLRALDQPFWFLFYSI